MNGYNLCLDGSPPGPNPPARKVTMAPLTYPKPARRWKPLARAAETRATLAALRQEQGQELRRLAHDLRNPVNSILLMAQMLEEICGSEELARIARRIQNQCDELSAFANRLTAGLSD